MKALFLALSLLAPQAHAACTGAYDLEGNANDSSGNARHGTIIGAGPTFITNTPAALSGSYCANGFTDANYISLPASVFTGVTTAGTIAFGFFKKQGDADTKVMIGSTHASGAFYIYPNADNSFQVNVPLNSGVSGAASAPNTIRAGRQYHFVFTWNSSSYSLYVREMTQSTYTRVIYTTGVSPNFTGAALVYLGRAANIGGFSTSSTIDSVSFHDATYTGDPGFFTLKTQVLILTLGHSWVQGTMGINGNCNAGATADGWRWQFQNEAGADARAWYFTGSATYGGQRGTMYSPYTDGVAGTKAVDMLGITASKIALAFPAPNANNICTIGPDSLNDCNAGTSAATYQAQIEATANSIAAHSALIKIFLVTDPPAPWCNVAPYVVAVQSAYANLLAAGKNVYLIDMNAMTAPVICDDTIHPTLAGYDVLGGYLYNGIKAVIDPAATPTPAPSSGRSSPYLQIILYPRLRPNSAGE